jgi:hypothetical protein
LRKVQHNTTRWRTVEVAVIAEKGKSLQVALAFLEKFEDNAHNFYTRIERNHNVTALFIYRHSQELHDIVKDIKNISYVKYVYSRHTDTSSSELN